MKVLVLWLSLSAGIVLTGGAADAPHQPADVRAASARAVALRSELKGCDRLKVVLDDLWQPNGPGQPKAPTEIKGAEKLAGLLALLDFDDSKRGLSCACGGDHQITFYRGEKTIAVLSHHHGLSLRWNDDRWDGDSFFQAGVSEAWCRWFKENGYGEFESMRLAEIAQAKAEALEHENFMKPFPEVARTAYEESMSAIAGEDDMAIFRKKGSEGVSEPHPEHVRFLKACGEPTEAGLALCRALGSLAGKPSSSWSSQSAREALVIGAFAALPPEFVPGILEKAASDDAAALGAARLCFFEGAMEALPGPRREEIVATLAREVVKKEEHSNISIAFRRVEKFWSPPIEALFTDIASGTLAPSHLPTIDDHEPGLRASAILALAEHGDKKAPAYCDAAESMAKRDSDRAALAIARAWLGDRNAIKREQFKIDSYTLAFSALACLERQGDRAALDLVITGGLEHSWDAVRGEAVLVTQRMTGKTWFKGEPNERESWYGKNIRDWWIDAKATWEPPARSCK